MKIYEIEMEDMVFEQFKLRLADGVMPDAQLVAELAGHPRITSVEVSGGTVTVTLLRACSDLTASSIVNGAVNSLFQRNGYEVP
jgi:hypothetical protein